MKNTPETILPIHARLKAILLNETDESGRFGWLQRKTEISRNTWQTWWDKDDAAPSGKMIEAAARLWPKYAFWLASGLTDEEYGHTYPKNLCKSTSWPEYEGHEKKSASDYFDHCAQMQMKLTATGEYENKKEWEKDWGKLDELSWRREIEIYSLRIIFEDYEIRLKKQPAKVNPWKPNNDDGIHEDE